MSTAVLVIDVQQALCSGEWAAWDAPALLARLNAVTARARAAGVPVVMIQHEEDEGPMVHGEPGWQLAAGLDAAPSDLHVFKRTCDSFHGTDLQAQLAARGITGLVVGGLQSEFCVDSTVRAALARGYPVTLLADGHSTLDTEALTAAQIRAHHNATLSNLGSFGPRVTLAEAADVRF